MTFGSAVLVDLDWPLLERFAAFRATGRFFWPAAYLLLTWALSVIAARFTTRQAALVLSLVLAVQGADLHAIYAARRQAFRDPELHSWHLLLTSPAWPQVMSHYRSLTIYPPTYCDPSALNIENLAFLAGLHHLSINGGLVKRFDNDRRMPRVGRLTKRW